MVYHEQEGNEYDIDRSAELYEDLSDYENFGERVDNSSLEEDELYADDTVTDQSLTNQTAPETQVEDSFGETLASNPHLQDQLEDNNLSNQAEADYTSSNSTSRDEGLLDKAKDKIQEWTGHKK